MQIIFQSNDNVQVTVWIEVLHKSKLLRTVDNRYFHHIQWIAKIKARENKQLTPYLQKGYG